MGGEWVPDGGGEQRISFDGAIWRYVEADGPAEEYDGWGRLQRITSPDGSWLAIEYDWSSGMPLVSRVINQNGQSHTFEYGQLSMFADERGLIQRVWADFGCRQQVQYYYFGQLLWYELCL